MQLFSKLSLLCLTCVMLWGVSEIFFRFVDPLNIYVVSRHLDEFERKFWIPDSILNHKLKPNLSAVYAFKDEFKVHFKTNRFGYRFPENLLKNKGREHIVFLGDSFIEAIQSNEDQTLPFYTQQKLDKLFPERFSCFNLGVRTYSAAYYYLQLKHEFFRFRPKIVVIGYYLGNDILGDNSLADYFEFDAQGDLIRLKSVVSKDKVETNRPASALQLYWQHYRKPLRPLVLKLFSKEFIRKLGYYPERWALSQPDVFHPNLDSATREYIDKSVNWILQAQNFCTSENAKLIVLLIPPGNQLQKNILADGYHLGAATFGRIYSNNPQEYIKSVFEKKGITFIDLIDVFNMALTKELYFPIDSHWTPEAQEITADTLAKLINDMVIEKDASKVKTLKPLQ